MLTTKQAAERIGIQPKTLTEWRARHYGPPFCRFGSKIQYREKSLEAWIEAQEENPARTESEAGNVALPVQGKRPRIQRTNRLGGYRTARERSDRNTRGRAANAERLRALTEESKDRLNLKEEA